MPSDMLRHALQTRARGSLLPRNVLCDKGSAKKEKENKDQVFHKLKTKGVLN